MKTIAFPHRPPPNGGPGSFQTRFESGLDRHGWTIFYADDSRIPDIVFVVGGTRKILWLIKCKIKGAKIIHRLDGIHWQHRVKWPGILAWLRAESINILISFIRRWLSDCIVYQSHFVRDWWDQKYGQLNKCYRIIHNGVDLSVFNQDYSYLHYDSEEQLICVEGTVHGEPAIRILQAIQNWPIKLYGDIAPDIQKSLHKLNLNNLVYMGCIPREDMPVAMSGRKIYLTLETNPPCPNSIIEALASGLPVVGFDSGSLIELVGIDGGCILPYGANPWNLDAPVTSELNSSISRIFMEYEKYSKAARTRAMRMFSIEGMMDKYISVLDGLNEGVKDDCDG